MVLGRRGRSSGNSNAINIKKEVTDIRFRSLFLRKEVWREIEGSGF